MKIQRFEGKDAEEALRRAQMALGPGAVVLQTRTVKASGLKALVGRPHVEVLAAVDQAARPTAERAVSHGSDQWRPGNPGAQPEEDNPLRPAAHGAPRTVHASAASPAPADWQAELMALRLEVARLRMRLHREDAGEAEGSRQKAVGSPDRWNTESRADTRSPLPSAFCLLPSDDEAPHERARQLLAGVVTRPIEMCEGTCTVAAVVGPTGVGKTMTVAKLAAAAAQIERKRVGLITIDCYRQGGVEPLEAYAHSMSVPLRVAYSAQELQAARLGYAEYDLVLIDTVGRSPRNELQLQEMAVLLQAASPREVHLVLDAGACAAKQESVLRGFEPLRPTHLLLSKLDEAPRLEDTLEAVSECDLPLSYLTTGQRVPEDLAPADRAQLRLWLSGGPGG